MTANQNLRCIFEDSVTNASCISAGTAGNVGHPDIDAFAMETFVFGKLLSDSGIINIPVNAAERFERLQLLGDLELAKIAGVPDLIAIFARREYLWVKETMSV